MPYIVAQLEELDLLDDGDSGEFPLDPIQVGQHVRGKLAPILFPASGDSHTQIPWSPTSPLHATKISIPAQTPSQHRVMYPPSPVPEGTKHTYITILEKEYHDKYSGVQVIPLVCVQTVKTGR
jgi:hypothetical protein